MTNKTNKQPSLIDRFVNITDDSLFMFDRILTDVVGVKEIFLYILHVLGVLNAINTRFIHTRYAGLYLASTGVGVLLRVVFLKRIASFRYLKNQKLKNWLVYVFEKN
jgi:hypothetical protein